VVLAVRAGQSSTAAAARIPGAVTSFTCAQFSTIATLPESLENAA